MIDGFDPLVSMGAVLEGSEIKESGLQGFDEHGLYNDIMIKLDAIVISKAVVIQVWLAARF